MAGGRLGGREEEVRGAAGAAVDRHAVAGAWGLQPETEAMGEQPEAEAAG